MLLDPARAGRNDHLAVGLVQSAGSPSEVPAMSRGVHLLDDVHLVVLTATVTWSGFGVELGQHVAGVVGQPLGRRRLRPSGAKRDRAADLEDHVGHGVAQPASSSLNFDSRLEPLPSTSRTWTCSTVAPAL